MTWCSGKESAANAGDTRDVGSVPGLGRSLGVGNGNPSLFPANGKFHGQRSMAGCSLHGTAKS